jgi:hypothetical protein
VHNLQVDINSMKTDHIVQSPKVSEVVEYDLILETRSYILREIWKVVLKVAANVSFQSLSGCK